MLWNVEYLASITLDYNRMMNFKATKTNILSFIIKQLEELPMIRVWNSLYVWNGVYYEEVDADDICRITKEIMEGASFPYSSRNGREVWAQLFPDAKKVDESDINCLEHIIPFKNGYFDYIQKTFIQPTPDYYYTGTLNANYYEDESKYKVPHRFIEMIATILPDEIIRNKVLTYMALCCTPRRTNYWQIWVGDGRNGKTELSQFLPLLLGRGLVAHVDLDRLLAKDSKFVMANFCGKWLNLGSEVSSTATKEQGVNTMKRIIINPILSGERKGEQKWAEWRNHLKGICDINDTPLPRDFMKFAFYRRWELIPFGVEIPEEDIVEDIALSIFEEEGDSIIRYILSFLPEVTPIPDAEETEQLWYIHSHSVFAFFSMHCEKDAGTIISKVLYKHYIDWCEVHNRKRPVTHNSFGHFLKSLGVSHFQHSDGWVYSCTYNPIPYQNNSEFESYELTEDDVEYDKELME